MAPYQIVAGYLILQAVGVAAWWVSLVVFPDCIAWFQPEGWPPDTLLGFWLADLVLLCGGSVATAWAVTVQRPWAATAVWALAAAAWYPTLYCVGVSVLTGQAWLGAAMMATLAGLSLAMATIYGTPSQQPQTIRATPLNPLAALGWTCGQIVIFWSVFLWILPSGIAEVEHRCRVATLHHGGQTALSLGLLGLASCLGLWSGFTMATTGHGTPLPTAAAPRLVVRGPYRYVRNPMALAGITQGLAVGWLLGSYGVIAYAICGAFVWHLVVRPVEERDLAQRFGESYRRYQRNVGLWLPKFSPLELE